MFGISATAGRFSSRSKLAAASLCLLAAAAGASSFGGSGLAQAAEQPVRKTDYNIAVVVPWQQVDAVHSFEITFTPPGASTPRTASCFGIVRFQDAWNFWSTPYKTDLVTYDPRNVPFKITYYSGDGCDPGDSQCMSRGAGKPTTCGYKNVINTVEYVDTDVSFDMDYVYTNQKTFENQWS